MSNSWNQWVLGYNPQRQREVLSRLGMREPDWKTMTAAMAVLCGLLLLGLVFWTLRKRIRIDPTVRAWNLLSLQISAPRSGTKGLGRANGFFQPRRAGPRPGWPSHAAVARSTSTPATETLGAASPPGGND
ncbi:MAG: hypothetical protein M5R42_01375 [Rhodocyclaceae bacterium]|nr:hypothetical protein [Rhodocyclaceae bacterium]